MSEPQTWLKLTLQQLAREATPESDIRYYRTAEDFALRVGRFFEPRVLPNYIPRGRFGYCYTNAAHLVFTCPDEYTYCEGFSLTLFKGAHFVCQHAWVCDREGRMLDPTYPLSHMSGDYCLRNVAFLGVPFPADIVLMSIAVKPVFTMLKDDHNRDLLFLHKYSERTLRDTLYYIASKQVRKRILITFDEKE